MLTDIQSALEVQISLKAQPGLWSRCCNWMREQQGKENVDFDFTDVLHLVSWSGLVAPLIGLSMGRWVKRWIFVVPTVFSDLRRPPQPSQSCCELLPPPNQLLAPGILWQSKALEGKLYISTNISTHVVPLYSSVLPALSPHSLSPAMEKIILFISQYVDFCSWIYPYVPLLLVKI